MEKKIETELNLNVFCVRDESGNCDVEATVAKFMAALEVFAQHTKGDNESIMLAIADVYEKNKIDILPKPFVINSVCAILGAVSLDAHKMQYERVENLLKSNPLFVSGGKGRSGGLRFVNARFSSEKGKLKEAAKETVAA